MQTPHIVPPAITARRFWERPAVCCILLLLLGIIARLPALQGSFVWDDEFLVRDNPLIKSPLLIAEAFRHSLFPGVVATHYRPVQIVSYCLDYFVWSTNAYGYHLSNILWHVASGMLLYLLCRRLLGQLSDQQTRPGGEVVIKVHPRVAAGCALAVAALWIVHPVHSAAVDYISGRADCLAFFFACGGWLLYLRARDDRRSSAARGTLYTLAAFSALLALCSRESGAVWMLLFLVYLFLFDRISTRRAKVIAMAVLLGVAVTYAGLRHLPSSAPAPPSSSSVPAVARAGLMLRALGDYGQLMVFPAHLHMERTVEKPPNAAGSDSGWRGLFSGDYLAAFGVVTAAMLLVGVWLTGRGRQLRLFGATWFVIAYLPISNLFDLNATVAEHWLYLPSVGFLLFLAGCCIELPPRSRKFIAATVCLAVALLSARSFIRSEDWTSAETLYRQTISSGGSKIRVALNLSGELIEKGDYAKAEPLLQKIVEMNPEYPPAIDALAHLLSLEGNNKEAEELFAGRSKVTNSAAPDHPGTWIAALNLARLHRNGGDSSGAIDLLETARKNYPDRWELVALEAELLQARDGADAALPLVKDFAQRTWWHAAASIALGRIYLEKRDLAQADAAFRHASRLDVHDAESVSLRSLIKLRENNLDEAYQLQCRAVARQPDEPRQYLILADVLSKMGRDEEARAMVAQVSRLRDLATTDRPEK